MCWTTWRTSSTTGRIRWTRWATSWVTPADIARQGPARQGPARPGPARPGHGSAKSAPAGIAGAPRDKVDRMASDLLELPDGRQAEVWHGGVATGPLVMFLHGTPDSRLIARTGDAAAVRAGVHLVAVNRPGYGRSDPAESGLASVADDTVAVADSLAVHRFAVLGASGGGPYALACA